MEASDARRRSRERGIVREPGLDVERRGPEAYVAELLGTFLLVFFVCSMVSVASGLGVNDFAVIGLVHIALLATLIYTLGSTSGAHFNPAVTLSLAALRRIAPIDALIYVLVQLSGAVAGALVTKVLLADEGRGVDYGATRLSELISGRPLAGLLAEFIGTFVLMWAIMGTAVNPRGSREWAGLVIGLALGLGVMVLGPLSGASFNPARTFGPAIVSGSWNDFWVYVVAPVLGALAAAFGYTAMVLRPQGREPRRPIDTLP